MENKEEESNLDQESINRESILTIEHVKRYFQTGDEQVRALDDVSFQVFAGEFVAITGESGSGKTTLLQILGGLDEPTSGHVYLDQDDIYDFDEENRAILRRESIGFVFQAYNLLDGLTVYDNIVLPVELDDEPVDEQLFHNIVGLLGINNKLKAYPWQLSGGQKQRVAIARALLSQPDVVLADEPTGNLDKKNSGIVLSLLLTACKKLGQTVVIITHDESIAAQADRCIRLEDGKIAQE